jgi:hypothetical protein
MLQVVRGYMQYTGEYRAGLMHGRGQMCWPDGLMCVCCCPSVAIAGLVMLFIPRSYDGEWCDGAKNGRGELLFPNGHRQHGVWEQDVLVHVLVHVVNGKVLPVVTPISATRK